MTDIFKGMRDVFKGMGVALVTPFTTDGQIDITALENLTERVITEGVDFLCVLGTTGEPPTLSEDEKALVRKTIAQVNAGRVPMMLGLGGNSTHEVCRQLQSMDLSDFQAVLSVVPYYNKPSQEGVYQHFRALSEASPLPLFLYNVPGRTGVNMTAQTTLRIAHDCPKVVAIKEASGNVAQIQEIIKGAPEGFQVFSGDDGLTRELQKFGISGVISVVANALAPEFRAYLASDEEDPRMKELIRLTMADGNPAGVKAMLHLQGRCLNTLRLPLVPVNADVYQQIENLI